MVVGKLGRKIYYQKQIGNVVFTRGEMSGCVIESTKEEDFATYVALRDLEPDAVEMLLLEYGEYAEDFTTCNGYRVNPATKKLEFSYPDADEKEPAQPPKYRPPLSHTVERLRQDNAALMMQLAQKGVL